ncbi:hypothetical protein ACFLW2_04465 [Chloroflexota bacterium]
MATRTLGNTEYKLTLISGGNWQIEIHQCSDPRDWDDVVVNIRIRPKGGNEIQIPITRVNIDENGKASQNFHFSAPTTINQNNVNIVIQWQ